jgi:3alpha(or 20beta)-hydroxysteroid dehydrogenase
MMLTGKTAIVTGAARGIGEGITRALCNAGAAVMLTDVLDDLGAVTARDLAGQGHRAAFCRHDVRDAEGWARVVAETEATFGGVDCLVNNAGVSRTASIEEADIADFRLSLEVNLLGAFIGMQAAIPAMKRRGGGSIINIASNSTEKLIAITTMYSATKAALANMGKSAAIHLAQNGSGIRVNSIHPGPARTAMLGDIDAGDPLIAGLVRTIPMGRLAEPSDIGAVAAFLASDGARYVTGAEYFVDGGAHFS